MLDKFPPLYQCSVCEKPVEVTPAGMGVEPLKKFNCEHIDAVIWANRAVTLRGVGKMNVIDETVFKVKLTVRQFLSALFGRSI